MKGKILYLDFWMTGCRPCLAGMPAVVRVAQKFAADTLICFMGICSAPYDNRISFYAAKRFHETELPQYYDSTGTLARAWNINGFPVGVLVDQAGRVRYTQSGFQRWEAGYLERDLRAAIERLRAGG